MIGKLLERMIPWFFLLFISGCAKEYSYEGGQETGKPPVANAGQDFVVEFPADSILLDGSFSFDPDGKITVWQWSMISGPVPVVFDQPNAEKPQRIAWQRVYTYLN